jgi:hypothetical protein
VGICKTILVASRRKSIEMSGAKEEDIWQERWCRVVVRRERMCRNLARFLVVWWGGGECWGCKTKREKKRDSVHAEDRQAEGKQETKRNRKSRIGLERNGQLVRAK